MTRRLSLLISWLCTAMLVLLPTIALYFLVDIDAFGAFTRSSIGLAIDWSTIVAWQWYAVWLLTFLYLAIGWFGLYFLRRPFVHFAKGELFNAANSRDLRRFAMLLLVQAFAKPIHFALVSIVLSMHHSAGNKMLAISFGSSELKMIAVGAVFWVVSNLLIEGCRLQSENRQFV